MGLELGERTNVVAPVLLERFAVILVDGFVVSHLFPAFRGRLVAFGIDWALAIIHMSAGKLRKTLIANVNYFARRIRDLTNILVLGEVNVSNGKAGDGSIKEAVRVSIHYTVGCHAYMTFGHVSMGSKLY